jgi:aspartate/methionine/tyrosine aminotransferase
MNEPYARRLKEIQPFKVMKLLARANELAGMGHDVVHMEVGEPDFPTPAPIVRAGMAALSSGMTRYTAAQGIRQLREAIAAHYARCYGLEVAPERIFVTAGGSGALLMVSALLLDPGDGMLMTDPGYPCNRHFVKAFNGDGQLVPVTPDDGYQLSRQLIERAWLPTTRGVLLASPANPTGAVVTRRDMEAISRAVRSRSGHLVVDEIYHGLIYSPETARSILEVDSSAFVVNSFSKYFGMTGWRLGWLVVPPEAVAEVEKLAQNLFICASSIAQQAALAAFEAESLEIMERQREEFRARRDFLVPALREIGFGVPRMPEGAFYVYARIPEGLGPGEALCERLLEEHFVAVTPGTDFGFYLAEEHVRFSYAQNLDVLREGIDRIAGAVRDWSGA